MTNTISSIYSATTSGFTSAIDGYLALGVLVTLSLVGFALASKFLPRKKKVV